MSDVDEARAAATGFETVAPDAVFGFEVDVFAPCAVGAILNSETIPLLNCRAVAGAANNQLAEPSDAELLKERGILFAPDYVVNSGGVIYLIALVDEGRDEDGIEAGLAGIADTLRGLFAEADADGITPAEAANRMVQRRLAA